MEHASSAASAGPEHGLFDPSAAGAHEAGPRRRRTHVRALRRGLVAFGPIACSVAGSRDKAALLPDDDSTSLIGERLRFGSGFTADDQDRKRVETGKSVSERVDIGGRRISIKQMTNTSMPKQFYTT